MSDNHLPSSAAKKTGGFLKEFQEFISRGNVIDLAVAVIIGAAFGKIIDSLVNDIIMPPIGSLIGNVPFNDMFFTFKPWNAHYPSVAAAHAAGAVTINWGTFLGNVVDFIIIAFVIFLMVKEINRLKREPPKAPTEKKCPYCATMIPIDAKKCPNCTTDLSGAEEQKKDQKAMETA
jgi:large conductance mechanosensitive channel